MTEREILEQMIAAARAVGQRVLAQPRPPAFGTMAELRTSFDGFDRPLQQALWDRLHPLRPEAVSFDELEGALPATGDVWIIDALDGAIQYLHDLPHWCVNLTLVRNGTPLAAVLHSPALDETYAALAGGGATRNDKPVAPAHKRELAAAFVGMSTPPFVGRLPRAVELAGRSLAAMLAGVGAVRNLGATSWQVADVAGGRLDGFWEYGVDDVNLLGAALIAREAGAVVTDAAGQPWRAGARSILVAGPSLHAPLLALLPPDDDLAAR
jgi:myo-inositol-1(or 4)-monophosphatase